MSRRTNVLMVMAAVMAGAMTMHAAKAQTSAAPAADDVVAATVEGVKIYRSTVMRAFNSLPQKVRDQGLDKVYATLLERMIQQQLLVVNGRKSNLADDPEVKERVKELEDVVIGEAYLNRLIEANLTPGTLEKQYEAFLQQNPPTEQVHARHILLKTETDAKNAIGHIAAGKNFQDAAREFSTGPSASSGGDLGFFKRGDMVKPFSDAAFAMKAGEVSQVPVKTRFGWHVIQVVERKIEQAPSFDDLKPQLMRNAGRQIAVDLMEKMVDQAKVERFTFNGDPLPALPIPQKQ